MRLASFIASAAGGILVLLCSISDVAAQSRERSGRYVGGGIGSNWASDIDQEGWTRDPLCYPTDACFDADPIPEISGYRWRYNIDATAGAVFEIAAGRIFDRTRLELSLAQRKNGLDPLLSHHKSNRVSWLERVGRGSWESRPCNTCSMGVFSKTVTLRICRIL